MNRNRKLALLLLVTLCGIGTAYYFGAFNGSKYVVLDPATTTNGRAFLASVRGVGIGSWEMVDGVQYVHHNGHGTTMAFRNAPDGVEAIEANEATKTVTVTVLGLPNGPDFQFVPNEAPLPPGQNLFSNVLKVYGSPRGNSVTVTLRDNPALHTWIDQDGWLRVRFKSRADLQREAEAEAERQRLAEAAAAVASAADPTASSGLLGADFFKTFTEGSCQGKTRFQCVYQTEAGFLQVLGQPSVVSKFQNATGGYSLADPLTLMRQLELLETVALLTSGGEEFFPHGASGDVPDEPDICGLLGQRYSHFLQVMEGSKPWFEGVTGATPSEKAYKTCRSSVMTRDTAIHNAVQYLMGLHQVVHQRFPALPMLVYDAGDVHAPSREQWVLYGLLYGHDRMVAHMQSGGLPRSGEKMEKALEVFGYVRDHHESFPPDLPDLSALLPTGGAPHPAGQLPRH